MDRVERLLNLLGALLDTERPLTRDEIGRRVPGYSSQAVAFRRAFERDKETLRAMGVPLLTEQIDSNDPLSGEGYRVRKDEYALDDPGLTRDEMDALALAASSVKLSDTATSMALLKLGSESSVSQQTVSLDDDEGLPVLFAARSEQRSVTFQYKNLLRTFDPYRLSFRNGHWYVNGYDHGHEEVRTYRLDRMSQLKFASEADAFQAPDGEANASPWLPAWQMGDEPATSVHLLIDSDQVELALSSFVSKSQVVERRDDGSVVVAFEVTNREAFIGYALGFLDHAEVLAPPDVRDAFVSYLREMAET